MTQPPTGTQAQYHQTLKANNLTYSLAVSSSLSPALVIPVPWPFHWAANSQSQVDREAIPELSNRHGALSLEPQRGPAYLFRAV